MSDTSIYLVFDGMEKLTGLARCVGVIPAVCGAPEGEAHPGHQL